MTTEEFDLKLLDGFTKEEKLGLVEMNIKSWEQERARLDICVYVAKRTGGPIDRFVAGLVECEASIRVLTDLKARIKE